MDKINDFYSRYADKLGDWYSHYSERAKTDAGFLSSSRWSSSLSFSSFFWGCSPMSSSEDRSNDNNKGANIAGAAGLPGRVTFQI